MKSRFLVATIALALCFAPFCFIRSLQPWQMMCVEALAIFVAAKWWLAMTFPFPSRLRAALFFAGTLGMDPTPFAVRASCDRPRLKILAAPSVEAAIGAVAIWFFAPRLVVGHHLLSGWFAMLGAVLLLHHGISGFSVFLLRSAGIAAEPIMRSPWLSRSLREFWGTRWNVAVRSLAHRMVFTPLSKRWGTGAAAWMVFVISGLVHEMVITIPAGGGYGGPTAYFLIQPAAIYAERKSPILRKPGWSRIWTALVILGPACLLFPPVFIERVILPLFTAIGALP